MQCFGDVQKVPVFCIDSLHSHTRRYAATNKRNEIIFTESANQVSKYEIDNNNQVKVIQSWSFDELNKLYSPLVSFVSAETKQPHFVAIHSCNTLVEWTLGDSNELEKIFSKCLKNLVVAIISFSPHHKCQPLLVFSTGYCLFLNQIKSALLDENQSRIDKEEKIIGIQYQVLSKNVFKLYFIVSSPTYTAVYKSILNKNSLENTMNETQKLILNKKIEAWTCLNQNLIGAEKENNVIRIYSLEPSISNSKQLDLLYTFESTSFETICSIDACSQGAICLLGRNEDGTHCVEVYETQYCTKIGKLSFAEAVLTKDFCVIQDRIFVTCKNNILLIPVVKQATLLSQLLTKSLSIQPDNKSHPKKNLQQILGITFRESQMTLEEIQRLHEKWLKVVGEKCKGISEEFIVSFFDMLTRNYLQNKTTPAEDSEERIGELEKIFTYLIKIPFNEVFLVSCLKSENIPFEQHLTAIEMLLEMLPCNDCSVILWISTLLDTNFTRFLIKPSDEAKDILKRIDNSLNESIDFYEELGPVKTVFDAIVKRDQAVLSALTNQITPIGQYAIEMLSFT